MAVITYDNKSTLNPQPSVADANKVTSDDMNEIKSVVNTNYEEVGNITNLNTTDKTSIVNAINSLQPTTLFYDANGNDSGITLNDNIENYSFYEITFSRGGAVYSCMRMSTKFTTNVALSQILYAGSITRIYTQEITISGNQLTRANGRYVNMPNSPTTYNVGNDTFRIYLIVGYK